MDDTRLHYYHSHSYDLHSLVYRLMVTDHDLRSYFHFDSLCGIITFMICVCAVVIITCSIVSNSTLCTNKKNFQELQNDADTKLPRRESVLDIRPAYNCIHKHLKQTDVFQEKTKRTLLKEHLEIELMNSRISCINKLLQPEVQQSQWRKSRSPKVYCRIINPIMSK